MTAGRQLALHLICAIVRRSDDPAMKLITEVVNGETYEYYPLGEHVVRAVGVCGGRPTFKYTRIEVAGTLDRLAAGESPDAIVTGYDGRVSRDAIVEALRIATAEFMRTLPELQREDARPR